MITKHVAAVVLAMAACGQTLAASSQLLGEQDFLDGALVASDSLWLTAQANENLPTTALYVSPGIITYFHDVDPTANDAILTFSLWDLDSAGAGNQVSAFWFDGVAQPIGAFETNEPNTSVKLFQFTVPGSFLGDGAVQVLLELGGSSGNTVGLDFSRLVVVPEPSPLALLMPAALALGWVTKRSAVSRRVGQEAGVRRQESGVSRGEDRGLR
jgi:hypothetical protein